MVRPSVWNATGGTRSLGKPALLEPFDIGPYLCDAVKRHFAQTDLPIVLKYTDPGYTILADPANACDAFYCASLGRPGWLDARECSSDAAMAVTPTFRWHWLSARTPRVDDGLWEAVREVTGQRNSRR